MGGLVAEPAATGLDGLDAVFRAVLCAGTVALVAQGGSRSRPRRRASRWIVLGASTLAVLAAGGSSAWLGGAGFGLALGTASARLNAPVLRALAAGMTGQAALRLDRPSIALGTAVVAVGVFALLAAGGLTGMPKHARRQSLGIGLAVTGLAVLASALGLIAVFSARPEVEKGVSVATSAVAKGRSGDAAGSIGQFDEAARSFGGASSVLGAWWARPAMAVPVVGRHSRALLAMADSGATLSEAGARAAKEIEAAPIRLANGAVPLAGIASLQAPAREALTSLATADARLAEVRSPWLVSPVSRRLGVLSREVSQTRQDVEVISAASEVAPALLGADRPRRYFLALQTPSELRGSGGFMGDFGEISADGGRLRLERLGRTTELNTGGNPAARRLAAPPDYMARYSRFDPHRAWQNINMSPDFPSVAQAVASLYPQSGGRPVDGVIAVDPLGLAALLKAVGPVQVREWPVPITADNAAQILLFEQYVRLEGEVRIDFLARVTDAVWRRLTTTNLDVTALARALSPAMAEKHIQMASTEPAEEKALERLEVAGAMAAVRGDFLGVVTQNASGNKIDWFLRRSIGYQAHFDPGSGDVRSKLRITLSNQAPAGGLPDYVIGSVTKPPLPIGANKLYLSIYSPLNLSGARLDGQTLRLESEQERGRHVYSAYVVVPAGGTSTVELDLEGRLESLSDDGGAGYGLDLHRQPFLAPDAVSTSVELARGWRANQPGQGGHDRPERLELVADRRVRVDVTQSG
ncbi:MAG: DUF4012 domain-containing protein [Actinomycetota bacterium]|nr:DUF4012 domain-containing protein [Actinomycetota bacterium]